MDKIMDMHEHERLLINFWTLKKLELEATVYSCYMFYEIVTICFVYLPQITGCLRTAVFLQAKDYIEMKQVLKCCAQKCYMYTTVKRI